MSNKSESKNLLILETISKTLANSSIHAIPNIVRNNNIIIKIVWVTFFLGSSGYCSFLIYQSILNYLSFDVVSLTSINSSNSIQFPMVTICSVNTFASKFSKEFLNDFVQNDSVNVNSYKMNFIYKKYKAYLYAVTQNDSVKSMFGFDINLKILSCVYSFNDCNITSDFEIFYDSYFGNCVKFNPKKDKYQTSAGVLNGLQLELFTDLANENNSVYSMKNGFNVFISDSITNSFYFEGIKIPLGFSTDIILNRYLVKKKPYPYNECQNLDTIDSYDSENFKKTFNYYKSYSQNNCHDICFSKILAEECSCVDLTLGPTPNDSLDQCIQDEDLVCNFKSWNKFIKSDKNKVCDCPVECQTSSYLYTTSFSNFPSDPYIKYILNYPGMSSKFPKNASYDYLKNRLAAVNIFYTYLSQTEIQEQAKMDLNDLISNIGGILGLFLGMSFLSFIEFVEIFFKIFIILVQNYQNQNKVKSFLN